MQIPNFWSNSASNLILMEIEAYIYEKLTFFGLFKSVQTVIHQLNDIIIYSDRT